MDDNNYSVEDDDDASPTGATAAYLVVMLLGVLACGLAFALVLPWATQTPHGALTLIVVVFILVMAGGAVAVRWGTAQ